MGDLYERRLADLYVKLSRVYGAHEPHEVARGGIPGSGFDYRSMLVRYIDLIGYQEGVDFLYPDDDRWTDAEYAEIQKLSAGRVERLTDLCGGPDATTHCDEIGDVMWALIRDAFPDDVGQMRLLLVDTPEAWLWGGSEAGGRCVGLVGYVADAFVADAEERILSGPVPVDPATTEPSE